MKDRGKWKRLFSRWKTDYRFKTVAAASVSLFVTVVFALYNGCLGIRHSSLWYGTICIYYLRRLPGRRRRARQREEVTRAGLTAPSSS